MTALEEIGLDYTYELIDLAGGEHLSGSYTAVNPHGKVPALLVDGVLLTENAAILLWLDAEHPDAKLLPNPATAFERAQLNSDIIRLSSVWHPYVRANMAPMRWTVGDPGPVRERGKLPIGPMIASFDARLQQKSWYYGDRWSIIDMYLYWCYTTAEAGQFDLAGLSGIAHHRGAIEQRPAFKAAILRENAALSKRQPT